jgi:hypothetical protein
MKFRVSISCMFLFLFSTCIYSQNSLFTITDAEKVLGEHAHLTDSISYTRDGISIYKSSYTADSQDKKTGKLGIVYFMAEIYPAVSAAATVYNDIRLGNKDHEGFKDIKGLGDEAYFHSDDENFLFVLVRKGAKMFRLKVNKTTSKTSLEEFNSVSEKITSAL